MKFLAILVVIGLRHVWGNGGPLQNDGPLAALRARVAARLQGRAAQVALVFVPALAVLLLQRAADGALYGLAELLLFVAVLLYALGRENLPLFIAEYLQAWLRGDVQAAFEQFTRRAGEGVIHDPSAASLHVAMRRQVFHLGYESVFPVLFWFLLAGPAGALLYRLAVLDHEQARRTDPEQPRGARLLHWLDWVPVRLQALSFALVGHFDAGIAACKPLLGDVDADATGVLDAAGCAALGFADAAQDEEPAALITRGAAELEAVATLEQRALVVWSVVIGLLLIAWA